MVSWSHGLLVALVVTWSSGGSLGLMVFWWLSWSLGLLAASHGQVKASFPLGFSRSHGLMDRENPRGKGALT